MDRTTYIDIGGKQYPMRFSLGATIQIGEKYGDLTKMSEYLTKSEDLKKQIEVIEWILELLIKQGCAYKNLFEKDVPVPDDAPVDEEGKYIPPDKEMLELGIDIIEAKEKIFECIGKGSRRQIETKEKKEKNAETM